MSDKQLLMLTSFLVEILTVLKGKEYAVRFVKELTEELETNKLIEITNKRNKWQQAIDDELVVCHLGTTDSPNYQDPRKALQAIIQFHTDIALDPRVSEQARNLITQGKLEVMNESKES